MPQKLDSEGGGTSDRVGFISPSETTYKNTPVRQRCLYTRHALLARPLARHDPLPSHHVRGLQRCRRPSWSRARALRAAARAGMAASWLGASRQRLSRRLLVCERERADQQAVGAGRGRRGVPGGRGERAGPVGEEWHLPGLRLRPAADSSVVPSIYDLVEEIFAAPPTSGRRWGRRQLRRSINGSEASVPPSSLSSAWRSSSLAEPPSRHGRSGHAS